MHPDRLRDALSRHDPDPAVVMGLVRAKRRARRRRRAVLGALTVLAVAATGFALWPRPAPPIPPRAGAAPDSGFAASGCPSLRDSLAWADRDRVSIIVARSRLTGRTALDGYVHHEVVLTGVRTLAGPPVPEGATTWVRVVTRPATPEPGVTYGGPDGTLWGPDGALLGIFSTQEVNKGPLGANLHLVPVVGDDVILAPGDCWNGFDSTGLRGTPYTGPLTEAPGSNTYATLAERGFIAVPLATIEAMVP